VGVDEAASLMGPLAAAAWASSAAGSGLVMLVSKRLGRHRTAALIRGIQAITVVAMGALGGVVGLAVAYLTCFAMLGASSPVHMAMVHDEAEASNRTTVTSLNNMCGMAAASLAGIVLGFVADASGVPMAMFIAAAVVAAAAPLYLIAGRRTRALAKAV
jgi:predicted MFS family arabinose efflux permease